MAIISIMIRTYSHVKSGGFADGGGTVTVSSGAAGPAVGTTTPLSPLTAKGDKASVLASKYVISGSFDSTDIETIKIRNVPHE